MTKTCTFKASTASRKVARLEPTAWTFDFWAALDDEAFVKLILVELHSLG